MAWSAYRFPQPLSLRACPGDLEAHHTMHMIAPKTTDFRSQFERAPDQGNLRLVRDPNKRCTHRIVLWCIKTAAPLNGKGELNALPKFSFALRAYCRRSIVDLSL